jgi:hypothetical protein
MCLTLIDWLMPNFFIKSEAFGNRIKNRELNPKGRPPGAQYIIG